MATYTFDVTDRNQTQEGVAQKTDRFGIDTIKINGVKYEDLDFEISGNDLLIKTGGETIVSLINYCDSTTDTFAGKTNLSLYLYLGLETDEDANFKVLVEMKGTKISDEPITYTYAPNGLTYNGDYAGEVYTEHDINKRGSYSDASGANNTWVVADGTTNVSVSDTTPRNYEGPSSDVYVVNNLDNSVVQVTDYYEGEVELLPANTVYRYDSDWNYVPVEGAYACSNYVMSNGVYKEGWRLDHGVVYDGEEVIENAYNLSFEERIEDEEGVHYINHLK